MSSKIKADLNENGVNYDGNLAFNIIEESDDSDTAVDPSSQISCRAFDTLSYLPTPTVSSSKKSEIVVGGINAQNSEIQVGPRTHINGNVNITQIIQVKSEVDNLAYEKTDPETPKESCLKKTSTLGHRIHTWHKVVLLSACGAVIITICAYFLILKDRSTMSSLLSTDDKESSDSRITSTDYVRIVQRGDWLAQPPNGKMNLLKLPAPLVIITHTAAEGCSKQSECVLRVRTVQMFHIESKDWSDIGYNFLVGGDGSVYVGRDWEYEGAHTHGYNSFSIGIAFIGTFTKMIPPQRQIDACLKLIMLGVKLGKITEDYKLFAHRQLMSTESPGEELYQLMTKWPHFQQLSNDTDIKDLLPNKH